MSCAPLSQPRGGWDWQEEMELRNVPPEMKQKLALLCQVYPCIAIPQDDMQQQ